MKAIALFSFLFIPISTFAQITDTVFVITEKVTEVSQREIRSLFSRRPKDLYIDKDWQVTSECMGEFGGTITFINRATNERSTAKATCPIAVHKIGEKYYVTNSLAHMSGFGSVYEISNPDLIDEVKPIELIQEIGVTILGSFVYNNRLFHIVSRYDFNFDEHPNHVDKTGMYVARIENGEFVYIKMIGDPTLMTSSGVPFQADNGHVLIMLRNGYLDIFENHITILRRK